VECLTANTSFTPYSTTSSGTGDIGVDTCDFSKFNSTADASTVYWRVRGIDDSATAQVAATSQHNTLECFGVPNTAPGPQNGALTSSTALGTPSSPGQECSAWSPTKSVAFPTLADFGNGFGSPATVSGVTLNCPAGAPADYACSTMPEISWQPVAHANVYEVTIADDASFTNIEHQYETAFLSLTPRDNLADYTAGKGYYVAVQACVGETCGTASEASFTKQTPKVGSLSATAVTAGERLAWGDLAGQYPSTPAGTRVIEAENYKVEVTTSSDTSFDNPIVTSIVDASCDAAHAATCYAPPATTAAGVDQTVVSLPDSGSFIWRVSPIDISSNVLPAATDSTPFTIDTSRPSFTITSNNGVDIRGPLTIRASEAVTGVSAASVHVVPAGGNGAVAGTLTQAAAPNTWDFRPTSPLVTGETYNLSVDSTVRDQANNSAVVNGAGVRTTTLAMDNSKAWNFHGHWTKHSASGARSGSYRSASAGHSADLVVAGSVAKLFACKGPAMGTVTVKVAGHSQKVSLHQGFTRCGVKVWHKALPQGEQTVRVTVSKGTGNVDEVRVT
jgi:hypothetical protein